MSVWVVPTAAEFKTFFARDFNYAPSNDPNNLNYVTDADINKAIGEAFIDFNSGLFGNGAAATTIFMYLAAFFLVGSFQLSSKGIASQSKFPINSTSVGGVSIGFQVPERYLKDPFLSGFTANGYGMRYLQFALPYTVGNVHLAFGTTTAS